MSKWFPPTFLDLYYRPPPTQAELIRRLQRASFADCWLVFVFYGATDEQMKVARPDIWAMQLLESDPGPLDAPA